MKSPTSPTNPRDPDPAARFPAAAGSGPPGIYTRPVCVEMPRLTWLQLLGWLSADRYEPGTVPWLDDLIDVIEKRAR